MSSQRSSVGVASALIVLLALAAGSWLRLRGAGSVFLFGDELHTLRVLSQPYGTILRTYDPVGSGIGLGLLQRAATDLFGRDVLALRLPSLAAGLAAVLLVYPVGRAFTTRPAAALATLALALSSAHVFYSRFGRVYALVALLALVLVYSVHRVLEDRPPRLRWLASSAAAAALLPWLHLAASALVLASLGAGALHLALERRPREVWIRFGASFAGAALACLALYLPAWDGVRQFVERTAAAGASGCFGAADVAQTLAGGRVAGWLLLVGTPLAALGYLARKRRHAALLLGVLFVPPLLLLAAAPTGGFYAYARYLLAGLPFALILLADAWVDGWRRLLGRPAADFAALAVGGLAVVAAAWQGPLGPGAPDDGPFRGAYTRLRPNPFLDEPFPETPAFYRWLGAQQASLGIVEFPRIQERGIALYRNYRLQHGQPTLLGLRGPEPEAELRGPYGSLEPPASLRESGAAYLVLHRDVLGELERYWRYWTGRYAASAGSLDPRCVEEHGFYLRVIRRARAAAGSLAGLEQRLRAELGAPVYRDETLSVFALRDDAPVPEPGRPGAG